MDSNHLNLLMNTKKVKSSSIKTQFDLEEQEEQPNNYNKYTNELFNKNLNNSSSDEIETLDEIYEYKNVKQNKIIDKDLNEIMQCISKVDNYILDNNYNEKMEKINNYLIDLIYLIKTKKQ